MAQVRIAIHDPIGASKTIVEVPDDVPMNRLIPALVTQMNLPVQQGSNPISYRLDQRETGQRLADDQTLAEAGIGADMVLTLQPEVTAGRR